MIYSNNFRMACIECLSGHRQNTCCHVEKIKKGFVFLIDDPGRHRTDNFYRETPPAHGSLIRVVEGEQIFPTQKVCEKSLKNVTICSCRICGKARKETSIRYNAYVKQHTVVLETADIEFFTSRTKKQIKSWIINEKDTKRSYPNNEGKSVATNLPTSAHLMAIHNVSYLDHISPFESGLKGICAIKAYIDKIENTYSDDKVNRIPFERRSPLFIRNKCSSYNKLYPDNYRGSFTLADVDKPEEQRKYERDFMEAKISRKYSVSERKLGVKDIHVTKTTDVEEQSLQSYVSSEKPLEIQQLKQVGPGGFELSLGLEVDVESIFNNIMQQVDPLLSVNEITDGSSGIKYQSPNDVEYQQQNHELLGQFMDSLDNVDIDQLIEVQNKDQESDKSMHFMYPQAVEILQGTTNEYYDSNVEDDNEAEEENDDTDVLLFGLLRDDMNQEIITLNSTQNPDIRSDCFDQDPEKLENKTRLTSTQGIVLKSSGELQSQQTFTYEQFVEIREQQKKLEVPKVQKFAIQKKSPFKKILVKPRSGSDNLSCPSLVADLTNAMLENVPTTPVQLQPRQFDNFNIIRNEGDNLPESSNTGLLEPIMDIFDYPSKLSDLSWLFGEDNFTIY